MIFKYSELRKFLACMAERVPVVSLGDWNGENAVVLRHDIDLDIQPAFELAEIEMDYGIRSTFMVMITCCAYNPASPKNRKMLRDMSEWGFEIGLHFDPNVYEKTNQSCLEREVDNEAEILSRIIGKKIRSVSLHDPSGYGEIPIFEGYANAYDKRIFNDEHYLSDSRMLFRNKNPYAILEKVKDAPIQILLHPCHYTKDGATYPDIFTGIARRYMDGIDNWFRVNSTYVEQMENDLFSYMIENQSVCGERK